MEASAWPTCGIITSVVVSADVPHGCIPEPAMMQRRNLPNVATFANLCGGHG